MRLILWDREHGPNKFEDSDICMMQDILASCLDENLPGTLSSIEIIPDEEMFLAGGRACPIVDVSTQSFMSKIELKHSLLKHVGGNGDDIRQLLLHEIMHAKEFEPLIDEYGLEFFAPTFSYKILMMRIAHSFVEEFRVYSQNGELSQVSVFMNFSGTRVFAKYCDGIRTYIISNQPVDNIEIINWLYHLLYGLAIFCAYYRELPDEMAEVLRCIGTPMEDIEVCMQIMVTMKNIVDPQKRLSANDLLALGEVCTQFLRNHGLNIRKKGFDGIEICIIE